MAKHSRKNPPRLLASDVKSAPAPRSFRWPPWGTIPTIPAGCVFILFFVFLFFFWYGCYADLLYLTSYYDTAFDFADSGTFCGIAWKTPAFLPLWLGRWTVALAVFPFVAALILALIGSLCAWSVCANFHSRRFAVFAFLLPLILTLLIPVQGYALFGCYSAAFFYAQFFGYAIALGLGALLRKRAFFTRWPWTAGALAWALYPALGGFALLTGLSIAVGNEEGSVQRLRQRSRLRSLFRAVLTLVVIGLVPICWYPFYAGGIPWDRLWLFGMNHETSCELDAGLLTLTASLLRAAWLAALLPMIFAMLRTLFHRSPKTESARETLPDDSSSPNEEVSANEKSRSPLPNENRVGIVSVAVLAIFCAAVCLLSRHDEAFFATLAAVRPLENEDWEEILRIEAAVRQPTVPLIELRRLALIETGRASEEMFRRPNVGSGTPDLISVSTWRVFGTALLFYGGNVQGAFHRGMNDAVVLAERSPYYAWMGFLASAANNEPVLAEKYARRLKKIDRFRAWGKTALEVLALEEGNAKNKPQKEVSPEALRLAERIRITRLLRPHTDRFDLSSTVTMSLIETALFQRSEEFPLRYVEGRLLRLLLVGDLTRFTENYGACEKRRAEELPKNKTPTIFQQALVYQAVKTGEKSLDRFDPETVRRWRRFDALSIQYHRTPGGDRQAAASLDNELSDTLWFYIFYCSHSQIY